jgi:hypothetical protein
VTRDSDTAPRVSGRVGLARLAAQTIALTDGVTATTGPAGRWLTVGSGQVVPGVLAVEDGRGRVDVELHLVARWPPQMPLQRLGEQVRQRLRRSAAIAGIGARLGAVSIAFDDVVAEATST